MFEICFNLVSINRESVSTNFISPNKTKYIFFEISSFSKKGQKSVLKYDLTLLEMILFSFTVIFTSFFQSNIELWIHFFFLWTKSVASVKEMFFKRKDSCWRKKKSFFILLQFKSLLVTRKLHLLRNIVRDDARAFVNTSKLVLPKHCFICRTRWQKHFFNS